MFVAIMNAKWDLRVPIAVFLTETRTHVGNNCNGVPHPAKSKLRDAWGNLVEGDDWAAVVEGIAARVLATHDELEAKKIELHEVEGRTLCAIFREAYPVAPPSFEKVGRLADGKDPDV
jgi:hypothetical protein